MEKSKLAAPSSVPRHVAIIMDGNNRWAKKRLLPGVAGHKAGVDAVRAVIEVCAKSGVEVLTLFAFSSENWQRPAEEVGALMELFFSALRREAKRLNENNISLRIIGDRSRFHPELQAAMREAEALTGRYHPGSAADVPGNRRAAAAGPVHPHRWRAPHQQFPVVATGLRRVVLLRPVLAGLQTRGHAQCPGRFRFAPAPLR